MFERQKANVLFRKLFQRPDIMKAYEMKDESDSWYPTLKKVHDSLAEIKKLNHYELEVESHDHLKLKAINYPAETTAQKNAVVIFIHGYTSHAEREWAFPGLFYHAFGYHVVIPYQRAHGMSEGSWISMGALESLDMIKWVEQINQIYPDLPIIIHGLSMGGSIALLLADKPMKNVKGIISDAPFLSIEQNITNIVHGIFKKNPDKILNYFQNKYEKIFKVNLSDYNALEHAPNFKYPILYSAGSNEGMEENFMKLKNLSPKDSQILILKGCDHGNGMYKQTEVYQQAIKKFLSQYVK